ncbi:cation:proton antiporter subunit C, partial [Amylibacter sp.]|nr:cation:proton antiporter subunit C [Amylibacter sp.]
FPMDSNYHVDQAAMQSNLYSNPLPHVLILTAIVVGIATTSLGLALIVRIRESFNTIDEEDILQIEQKMTREDNQKYKDDLKGML